MKKSYFDKVFKRLLMTLFERLIKVLKYGDFIIHKGLIIGCFLA